MRRTAVDILRTLAVLAGGLALCLAAPAGAQVTVSATSRYVCDRGVEIPVVYINAEDGSEPGIAVLYVEGRMINLQATTEAASGVRYRFPNDGSGYVWWTHQETAHLLWYDAETGEEVTLYADCAESGL